MADKNHPNERRGIRCSSQDKQGSARGGRSFFQDLKNKRGKVNMKKIIYRQGDVMLISSQAPKQAKPVEPDNGRVILAYGEVTGHAHALLPDAAPMVFDGQDRYISANEKAVLRHEEHTHLPIIPASYKVVQQCEYSPEAIRRVAD